MTSRANHPPRLPQLALATFGLGALLLTACSGDDGDRGPAGPPAVEPPDTTLSQGEELPGIDLEILAVTGGTGQGGKFRVGDTVRVRFTVKNDAGDDWELEHLSGGRTLVSGPTSNYQRVLAEQSDVLTRATANADGSYTYVYATPIPATYLAPYNDSPSFGVDDGELSGLPLLDGTYTVGLYVTWSYTLDGESKRAAGDAVADFLLGSGAGALASREVVAQENCNQCHEELQAHGGQRKLVTLCLMCHTAGAEDKNVGAVAGGTPGTSVEFKVMVHKIHAGKHLPSVLGVSTDANGARDYAATPAPYEIVGYGNSIHDFSEVGFTAMPSAYVAFLLDKPGATYTGAMGNGPMPRDAGYSALPLPHRRLEDLVRTGVVSCQACHGDPDGAGPLDAPADGGLAYSLPSRNACGSCHTDVLWDRDYTANAQTMGPQANDNDCLLCHGVSGTPLSSVDAHIHPFTNPNFNSGVNIAITGIAAGSGGGGNHAADDTFVATFAVTDDAGDDLLLHDLTRFQMMVTGPVHNQQWVLPNANPFDFAWRKSTPFTGTGTASKPTLSGAAVQQTIAVVFTSATTFDVVGSVSATLAAQAIGAGANSTAQVSYNGASFTLTQGATAFANGDRFYFEVLPLAASYSMAVPRDLNFERLGAATGAADVLTAGNAPIYWGRQVVFERTALVGASAALTGDSAAYGRYVEVDASTLAGVAVGDRVVVDNGLATEEYLQVGRIQTADDETGADLGSLDRVWFSQALRYAHSASGTIQECTLTSKREGVAYSLAQNDATEIQLVAGQFGAGNPVVMSYRTHGRFGFRNGPGEALQAVYPPVATGDSDDIDETWGDWKGHALVAGTYKVGMWANRDFSVSPLGLSVATEVYNNLNSDNTTYRMISPPATASFLYGSATAVEDHPILAMAESCNRCHVDIQAHGFGRRGLETCILCHSSAGAEDASLYAFDGWYIGATPQVTMDFRSLLHKIHMGKDLANASSYAVNGIFLGAPYPVSYEHAAFTALPGEASNCQMCHGEGDGWREPRDRDHPSPLVPKTREWRNACGSCHDSEAAFAHIESQTILSGAEACGVCHGEGKDWGVEKVHKTY
jgi:hypothetical protein